MQFNYHKSNNLTIWLCICCVMVILMIFLGGLTRLTNSGLSIVEWKPLSGIIPPLTGADWQLEFSKYQTSPEYTQLNNGMSLAAFKFIYWLEFIHRLAGRLTGIVYLLPLLYFYKQNMLSGTSKISYSIILSLFAFQGFVGWYMVKSGLDQLPFVSHFRLSLHLITAFIIYSLLFWQLMLTCKSPAEVELTKRSTINLQWPKLLCALSIGILYLQIILGGLTAGLHAGFVYNTFPLMGTTFIADEINLQSINIESFYDPVFIQFLHRVGAYLVSLIVVMLVTWLFRSNNRQLRFIGYYIILALSIQVLAGILTLIYAVPIAIALIHQLGAIALLSCLLWCYYNLNKAEEYAYS